MNIGDFVDLNEDEGIKTLCYDVRKSAGTIPNPAWVAPVPNNLGLVAPNIPRPGLQIPAIYEKGLTLSAYRVTLYNSIGRAIDSVSLSRARLREINKYREMVTNHTEPTLMTSNYKNLHGSQIFGSIPYASKRTTWNQ